MTISVHPSGDAAKAVDKFVPQLVADKVASRLFQQDHTLWGPEAEAESAIRLGWVNAASKTLELMPELLTLRAELLAKGLTRVVLCGMGGSSLAPEVITKTFGKDLVVLDSTDPSQVKSAIANDLQKTVVVVSSKSGSTVETDSQKRSFEQAFTDAGIDKTERIFVVTDPDSPMHVQAVKDGFQVFLADPMVGGRYSALTAFGAVPSVLAGVDMTPVLIDAVKAAELLQEDTVQNPGLVLGAAMARTASSEGFKDKLGLVRNGSQIIGFGDWAEQLIAESTGKIGRGVLPVVLELNSPEGKANHSDLLLIDLASEGSSSEFELAVSGSLGEQLLLWEVATAVASRLLGVNPFDQPDVESAKIAARALLDSPSESLSFNLNDGSIDMASLGFELSGSDVRSALASAFEQLSPQGYVSIHAYLNREAFSSSENLRDLVAAKTGRPTTFGWGPRFLHSTGQYHKGGPKQGVFIQFISGAGDDQVIPGRSFGYRQLIDSQASGDAKVLADNGSPVLILRLQNPAEGIKRLTELLS
jgi:transaldolase / glucose-6-phosphate isomerase